MSLLSQLNAFVADGTIAKASKPRKKGKSKTHANSKGAKKFIAPGDRLPGERHGWSEQPVPAVPKPTMYVERKIIHGSIFILPVMIHYLPEELEAATYDPFAFLGCSPFFSPHLHLHNEV